MLLIKRLAIWMLGSLLLSTVNGAAHAETIHAAVAANFTAAMKEIAEQFERNTDHTVILSFGSSGKIFAQIQHGAPFQVFLSADQTKPEALEKSKLSVVGSRFTYAVGALALWSSKPGFIDNEYSVLKNAKFNKLALANPKLAPYGSAAVQVLTALKLKHATEPLWVMGENIAQTYQFVGSGNADLGFVALSQIMDKGQLKDGSAWVIPAALYTPIRQDAVLLSHARESIGAKALLAFLRSPEAQEIIHAYGYTTD